MEYQMHLNPNAFSLVISDAKTVELRINDDKRKKIKIGDLITFTNLANLNETITVKVVLKRSFVGFHELFSWINPVLCGWSNGITHAEAANYMVNFYKEKGKLEVLREHGAVAIEFEKV